MATGAVILAAAPNGGDTGGDLTFGPQKQLPLVTAESNDDNAGARDSTPMFPARRVSFLTDVSSGDDLRGVRRLFTTVAGVKCIAGLIEGLVDLSASSLNHFAGWLPIAAVGASGSQTRLRLLHVAKLILLVSSSIGASASSCHRAFGHAVRP